MAKLTTLDQLKLLATKVKTEDDALGARIDSIVTTVEGIVATGGEANVLNGIKVNGNAMAITDKMVDILVAAGEENGTISVGGATVAITGLQALAYKAKISEADLEEALLASIAAKATNADLQALTTRVTTAEGAIEEIQGAGYQTATQVQTAIQTAIAATNHAYFVKVDTVPTPENAEKNAMYLVMNADTGHYDIYALVGTSVERLDDTTVDLSAYSTTEQMDAAISEAVEALNIGDYAKAADLLAALGRIATLETSMADVYTKDEAEARFADEDEAAVIARAQIVATQASDEEVSTMLDEVFGPAGE